MQGTYTSRAASTLGLGLCCLAATGACTSFGSSGEKAAADAGSPSTSKEGGTDPTSIIARGERNPRAIAVDGTRVYWANDETTTGAVKFCPLAGCEAGATTVADNQARPVALTLGPARIYWVNFGGAVMVADKAAGVPTQAVVATAPTSIVFIPATNFVFWTEQSGVVGCPKPEETCGRDPRGGGGSSSLSFNGGFLWSLASASSTIFKDTLIAAPIAFRSGLGDVTLLATNSTRVFWVRRAAGGASIHTASMSAPLEESVLAASEAEPAALAADDDDLFWTDSARGTIRRLPLKAPSAPITVADGRDKPHAIAIDADFVYWTELRDGRDGAIVKARR